MPPKFAFPILIPPGWAMISINLPGIARHTVALAVSRTHHLADGHTVAQQHSITRLDIRQQLERNVFHGAGDTNFPHSHSVLRENLDDVAVKKVHTTCTPRLVT